MEYSSKNRAAVSLGIPKTTLDRYINFKNYPVYSPVLDMEVFLIDPSKPLSQGSPDYRQTDNLIPITEIDLYKLEKGKLFALLLDKKSIFGVYDNPSQAAKSLDGKAESKYISRYINLEYPVSVGPDKEPVYFVMNPEWKADLKGRVAARPSERKKSSRSKPIVLVDTSNNMALLFDTVSELSRYLGRNSITDTKYVKQYMNPTKLYKGKYEFYYESDFTGTITGKGPGKN
jgi:chemotaxis signal transduction protein